MAEKVCNLTKIGGGGMKSIVTSSPTVDQLKSADMVIARVNLTNTSAVTEIVCAFGDGQNSVGITDRSGTKITISVIWNKTNGTLAVLWEGGNHCTITAVRLFYFS